MINWEAIFAKYKEVSSVFYKLKQGSSDVAAFDKAVATFYTKVYGLQDVKKQLRYFFQDVNGAIYTGGINPNTECGNEESVAKALAWLI